MSKTCIIFLDANHQDAYNLEKKRHAKNDNLLEQAKSFPEISQS
jgi:hypothetical protein